MSDLRVCFLSSPDVVTTLSGLANPASLHQSRNAQKTTKKTNKSTLKRKRKKKDKQKMRLYLSRIPVFSDLLQGSVREENGKLIASNRCQHEPSVANGRVSRPFSPKSRRRSCKHHLAWHLLNVSLPMKSQPGADLCSKDRKRASPTVRGAVTDAEARTCLGMRHWVPGTCGSCVWMIDDKLTTPAGDFFSSATMHQSETRHACAMVVLGSAGIRQRGVITADLHRPATFSWLKVASHRFSPIRFPFFFYPPPLNPLTRV